MRAVAIRLACLALVACPSGGGISVPPDVSSPALAACANLQRLGCAVGADPGCTGAVERALVDHHTSPASVDCARTATTKAGVWSCGLYFGCD